MHSGPYNPEPVIAPVTSGRVIAGSSDVMDYRKYIADCANIGPNIPDCHADDPAAWEDQDQDDPVTRFILDRLLIATELMNQAVL